MVIYYYSYKGVSGTLKINGQVRDEKMFRKLSCYIMQEDKIQPMLTLNEVMMFAAELKLSNNTLTKEKQMIVSTKINESNKIQLYIILLCYWMFNECIKYRLQKFKMFWDCPRANTRGPNSCRVVKRNGYPLPWNSSTTHPSYFSMNLRGTCIYQ